MPERLARAVVARMSPAELARERASRAMSGVQFGTFLAQALGRARAYDRREVSYWETGARPVPEAVERVLLRLKLHAQRFTSGEKNE